MTIENGVVAATRILMIEDDSVDEENIRRLLQVADGEYAVSARTCLQAGVEVLRSEEFDVVLLDLTLPDSYGMDTVKRLVEEFPGTPIIVLSGVDAEHFAQSAIEHGVKDYLIKGQASGQVVCEAISRVMESVSSDA